MIKIFKLFGIFFRLLVTAEMINKLRRYILGNHYKI